MRSFFAVIRSDADALGHDFWWSRIEVFSKVEKNVWFLIAVRREGKTGGIAIAGSSSISVFSIFPIVTRVARLIPIGHVDYDKPAAVWSL